MTREEATGAVHGLAFTALGRGLSLAVACETMRREIDALTATDRKPGDDGDAGLFGVTLDVEPDAALADELAFLLADADALALAAARGTLVEISSPLRRPQA